MNYMYLQNNYKDSIITKQGKNILNAWQYI
jgi:hypothetical protein